MESFKLLIIVFMSIVFSVQGVNKTFVPTDTWKTIEEGESIPAGLHVRINLQTGKKEAKLMSDDLEKTKKSSLVEVKEEYSNLDPEEIKEFLKNIKNEDVDKENSDKKKFRSYEDIKKDFESLKMNVRTDLEIMGQKFDEFRSITNSSIEASSTELIAILSDFEYLVHQYDNAIEFARLGGFSTIIIPCLNTSKNDEVRSEALKLFGSSTQSNPKVQKAAVEAGLMPILLKLLALERNLLVRSRSLYALSCLLRSFPPAQLSFVQGGGISVLSEIFDDKKDPSERTKLKIINLLTDLLMEIKTIGSYPHPKHKEYQELTGLELNLREQGWCVRAAEWFCNLDDWAVRSVSLSGENLDHNMVVNTLDFLQSLSDSCLADFVINIDLLSSVNFSKELYADLSLRDLDEGVTDSLYVDILQKLRNLAGTLARTNEYRDEL